MRELIENVETWQRQGKSVALATVVKVWGSAPRRPGAKLVVSSDGDMVGSVSGGCVEGAVVTEARAVMETGRPKLVRYEVSDDQAWSVGLTCGGTLEAFIEPWGGASPDTYAGLRAALAAETLVTLATVVGAEGCGKQVLIRRDGSMVGDLGSRALNERAAELSGSDFRDRGAGRRVLDDAGAGEIYVFFETFAPKPTLVIVGAVHVAIPLVTLAGPLGFRTVVVDPRASFATEERFPRADELIRDWPQDALTAIGLNETTSVAVLSHDMKIDMPALELALRSPARYIGALGSKATHAKRVSALEEAGFSATEIDRIHSPIGLDIGGRRAEDIALSIIAQVVAVAHGKA
jgi:xanthine dehydrogenase accessory factor